jgi:hypothetical protein
MSRYIIIIMQNGVIYIAIALYESLIIFVGLQHINISLISLVWNQ